MDNKKYLIITIAVLLLIFLGIVLCFKFNVLNNTEENIPEVEAVQEAVETTTENQTEASDKTDSANNSTTKPVARPVVKPVTLQKTVDTKADEKAVNELKEIEKITEKTEPSNVVVIDQEYKMKSKDKYTFK